MNKPIAQPMKPMICSQMRPDAVGQNDGEEDADDQQDVDQRGTLGGEDSRQRSGHCRLRTWSEPPPIAAARMIGVKMPMP